MTRPRPQLPPLSLVRQKFDDSRIMDVGAHLQGELEGCGVSVPQGARVAVAVGSRGIHDLRTVVRGMVQWLRGQGAEPFLVPAMGSHGGATAEGQRAVLEGYGLTTDAVGASIRASMEVVRLPQEDCPVPVYFDRNAAEADATIAINRIKLHTDFHGPYESGLMKMLTIGLGKHAQALAIHSHGVRGLRDYMPAAARQIIRHSNLILGVALVENQYDRTCALEALPADQIPAREPKLLEIARTRMPSLPLDELDLLVVDQMGKDISGVGLDPNIVGRLKVEGEPEPERPRIGRIGVRSLTPASHGNAIGMGLADFIHRDLRDAIDWHATYENARTSTFLARVNMPICLESDAAIMRFATRSLGPKPIEELKLARIKNTLDLEYLVLSEAALRDAERRDRLEVVRPVKRVWQGNQLASFPQPE